MTIKPLMDRIVIKVVEDTEQTSGGIFIPDSAKEKPQKGEVVAVGEGGIADLGNAASYFYALHADAAIERACAYLGHAVGNGYPGYLIEAVQGV